jgi:hypothetical protein
MRVEHVFMSSYTLDIATPRNADIALSGAIQTMPTKTFPVHDAPSLKHSMPVLFGADARYGTDPPFAR